MRKSTIFIVLGICLILCQAILPVAAYIACYFLPRAYTSQVTIEIRSDQRPLTITSGIPNTSFYSLPVDPHFVADQLQILQSKGLLYPVIDELGLVDKWSAGLPAKLSKEAAYIKLMGMIRAWRQRDTDMVVVAVTSPDTQEAADIANAIALTYQKLRRDDLERQIDNALSELHVEVDKQRAKVQQALDEVTKIRQRDNIIDSHPDTLESGDEDEAAEEKQWSAEYQAAKQNYINAKRLLDAAEAKYESESMEMHIALVPAKIWDRAEPARFPSSPNVPLFLLIATALGFLCALCGAVLLFIGMRLRRQEPASPA